MPLREELSARVSAINRKDYLIIGGVVVAVVAVYFTVQAFRGPGKPEQTVAATENGEHSEDTPSVESSGDSDSTILTGDSESLPKIPRRKVAAFESTGKDGECLRVEYPGDGPTLTRISASEWAGTTRLFYSAKGKLSKWLQSRRKELGAKPAELMAAQLRKLSLGRPPSREEPDLAWRGIGVLGHAAEGKPVVRLGGGFSYLVRHNPARAKFEMLRMVAQVWAPCELKRAEAGDPWSALSSCLGVSDSAACEPGSYSEAGWAVSTALAAALEDPGCKIPAFKDSSGSACVAELTGPAREVASAPAVPTAGGSQW